MLNCIFAAIILLADPSAPAAVASPAPAAADPAALLAKHHAYVGWQADDGALPGLLVDETWSTGSAKPKILLHEARQGIAYRDDYELASQENMSAGGFTGNLFWSANDNGNISPVIGDTAKYRLARDVLFSEGTSELPGTFERTDTVGGKAVDVVRVQLNGSDPIHLFIDPNTGAYLRATIGDGDDSVTFEIHSYLPVGKKQQRIIGSYSIGDNDYNFENPEVGSVPTSALHPPLPAAQWTFASDAPFNFTSAPDGFYVEATVNGVPGYFELDTGDSGITLTDNFANRLHLKADSSESIEGGNGSGSALVRRVDTIGVGGNTLSNVRVTTVDVQSYDDRSHRSIDGFFGYDFLAGAIVSLDPSSQKMRIQDPSQVKVDVPGAAVMVADLTSGVPYLPVDIDGTKFNGMIDSGNSVAVLISRDVEKHGVELNNVRQVTMESLTGTNEVFCGAADVIKVGVIKYLTGDVCENSQMHGQDAIVGFDFMRNFKYVFDYSESKIYMTSDPFNSR